MTLHNWLYHYKMEEGLHLAIRGMCKRYPILGEPENALEIIRDNYTLLQALYFDFFPELVKHVEDKAEK